MYEVIFLPAARNYLKKIRDKNLKKLLKNAIDDIAEDYTIGEPKTGDLAGIYGYDVFYNKTNYEISYTVEEVNEEIVVIIMVGTRENFYNELKRYIKKRINTGLWNYKTTAICCSAVIESGLIMQSKARIFTPALEAFLRASPKALWVTSLGLNSFTFFIWITKII